MSRVRETQPECLRPDVVGLLSQGIASHHAGCLPGWKALVERLFQRGLVKVVFATDTLAAGINMPARTTGAEAMRSVYDVWLLTWLAGFGRYHV